MTIIKIKSSFLLVFYFIWMNLIVGESLKTFVRPCSDLFDGKRLTFADQNFTQIEIAALKANTFEIVPNLSEKKCISSCIANCNCFASFYAFSNLSYLCYLTSIANKDIIFDKPIKYGSVSVLKPQHPNLVNYWEISQDTKDKIGGMDIVNMTNGALINDRNGNLMSALEFKNGYGILPAGNYFSGPEGLTIMLWAIVYSSGSFPSFFEFGNADKTASINLGLDSSSLDYLLRVQDENNITRTAMDEKNSVSLNTWTHLTLSIDVDFNANFYLNGNLVMENKGFAYANDIVRNSNFLGTNNLIVTSAVNPFFNGALDDIKIFNRCLNIFEIRAEKN